MADAIHEVLAGERMTLIQVASLYYAVGRPTGEPEPGRLARVIAAIRARTGGALRTLQDSQPIPAGTILRVPTLRTLPRAVCCDDAALLTALMDAGYDHANKLLQRTPESVVSVLGPYTGTPYTADDVRRVWALTSLLDLDGMDRRTALHLHDAESIRSIAALARQSEASLQQVLERLTAPPHGRPAALAREGHAARWRASARILSRKRFSERVRHRPYQLPFPSRAAAARAAHYETIERDTKRTAADRTLARRLALLHRFQASVLDGNFYAIARRWDRAGAAHGAARRLFHRLVEDVGAASGVDDVAGVNLDIAIETVHRLLETMPDQVESPLNAPPLRMTFDDSRRPFSLVRDPQTPSVRTLLLPASHPKAAPVALRLSGPDFSRNYRTQFLNPQLAATKTGQARFDDAAWVDSATFAAITPYLYGGPVRATLGMSAAMQGHHQLANQYASPYFDLVASDGRVVADWSSMDEYVRDLDLGTCSTDFVDPQGDGTGIVLEDFGPNMLPLSMYCEIRLALGDTLYRQDRRSEASTIYGDLLCAIENYWKATRQSFLATDARTAFSAVANAALTLSRGGTVAGPYRAISQLSLLGTAYEDGTPVTDGYVTGVQVSKEVLSIEERVDGVGHWFSFEAPGAGAMRPLPRVEMNGTIAGAAVTIGPGAYYVDAGLIDTYYFEYLHAQGKLQAIASGLNWFGYQDTFVPSWSFEYLHELASDLAAKAVDAERHVFQMEQLYEQALEKEFLASQSIELAEEQLGVAEARVAQAEAAATLASQQALLSVEQASAAASQSALRGWIDFDDSELQDALAADPETGEVVPAEDLFTDPLDIFNTYDPNPNAVSINSALSGIPYFGSIPASAASRETALNDFVTNVEVLKQTVAVAQATETANAAACATAAAERDVAQVVVNQAQEYLDFLQDQTLNSEGLEQLVALAAQVHGLYHYQAHRMAWLAQRAAAYESRRTFAFIGWDYETGDQLRDMMRSEFLRADLDALRAEYTAGQTARMQELKWTVPLSRLDAGALSQLRASGRCVFVLRQDWVDREFPGTFLHRLKDVQVSVVGLLPPGGARGVLSMSGISWVRVPNTGDYASGETRPDWTTTALAGSKPGYDNYVMKRLDASPADISLSEFSVASDRAVLSTPRGMLRPLENLGLDTAWTLAMPARSNPFLFANIRDVELTFWFLCCYDPLLQSAQDAALQRMGQMGRLSSAARMSAVASIGDQLAALQGPVRSPEQVDTRYLKWRLLGLPQGEASRRVTNVQAVCARRAGTIDEITFRLLSQSSPAGVRITTTTGGALSLVNLDTGRDPNPPPKNETLAQWLLEEYYDARRKRPTEDPQQSWVVKFSGEHAGSVWEARDEDGASILSSSGPLTGADGGIAIFSGGTAWANCAVTLNVRKNGGRAAIIARYASSAGGQGYLLSLGSDASDNVKLVKMVAGRETTLAQTTIPYADDEFLAVTLRVYGTGTTVELKAEVDQIPILSATDSNTPLGPGTIALRVDASPRSDTKTSDVAFDDVRAVRLSGLGAVRDTLLSESFTSTLPAGWTFKSGVRPWTISPTRHKRLALSKLLNVVLTVDYQYTLSRLAESAEEAVRRRA